MFNRKTFDDPFDYDVFNLNLLTLKALLIKYKVTKIYCFKNDICDNLRVYNRIKLEILSTFQHSNIHFLILIQDIILLTDPEEINQVLKDFHDSPLSGHQGVNRMLGRIGNQFKWIGLRRDVKDYVRKCPTCQLTKHGKISKQPLAVTSSSKWPFELVSIDLMGPLPKSPDKFTYILSFQDDLTRVFGAVALKDKTTDTVARAFVDQVILKYGLPQEIRSDNGSEFISELFTKVLKL